ncbi:hypothetical protein GALMADRAFT_132065 [Galerina marginata CBS 339.88]|uniref:Heparinase II/III-like C-terminal domain-containing protein n=1 Tax=Galerina marginata (strain CBS 339.88) TaxID=685588 RepID=A0A067TSR4_GALM3|nr:hypothetical protein GALMADRAFT_132065 [Galerina marginata CBS 339.88]
MAASYNALNNNNRNPSPYGSGDPYYNESSGFITPHPVRKRRISNWIKFGIPVLILVIAAAVVGGVVGSRKKSSSASANGGSAGDTAAAASSAASVKLAVGRFATATDSEFMVPIYPSTTNTAAFTTPTFISTNNAKTSWPQDPFQPTSPDVLTVRPDRPRLIAPAYKWQALPALIQNDPYLQGWNATIFGNATAYANLPPVAYHLDGDSGILDNAREVKMRIKAFAYAYRMSNDTKWVDRAWAEIKNAAGNGTTPFGPDTDKWNTVHFLDTAEFSAAFGIAYDWLYDLWSDDQKSQIRSTLIQFGLQPGLSVFTPGASFGWWSTNTEGNWNCVCNGGLTLASLAILEDDTTGIAKQLLGHTVDNAKANCALAVSDDGTWAETANYWYFGTTGHAEMASALLTATGSDYGLLDGNTNFYRTGQFHMYAYGPTSLFNYGDHGPNKFSTTANSMFLYSKHYNQPSYALFQREQQDAAEPWSMFWYDPTVSGAFWDGTPLDLFFDNGLDQWASMRSSWTDQHALFVAIKAGQNQHHQTHNDLDVGDFVLDALGTRWAGELGSGDYLSKDYFLSDAQDATRWMYYRKMTEGQNTILVNKSNQNVLAAPTVKHGTTNTTQGSSTVIDITKDSTAFWTADMTSAYFSAQSVKRGVRMLNARKQVLLQDELNVQSEVQWRMHTNATVTIDSSGTSASLALDGQTMTVQILNAPSGAAFTKSDATRFASDVTPPVPDQANPDVTVLIIDLPAGTYSLQVLFNPQWPGMSSSDFVTPASVALDSWSLTSHN